MRNLRQALRILFRTPLVTAIAVLSLALGIGSNVAIFSLFEQILLRPLPVAEPDRLVNLAAPGPKPGNTSCNQAGDCEEILSYPMFRDLQRAETEFAGIAGHRSFSANLAFRGETLNGEGVVVSGSYFPVLGLRPALGRLLGPADDRDVGAHPVAVLSYRFWETRLGADPGVLNQTLVVNGQPLTIVGVAPRGFEGTTLGVRPNVFVPLSMQGVMVPGWTGFEDRQTYWIYAFARLKPGVSLARARAAVNAVYRPILAEVEAPLQSGMSEETLARFVKREITLEPGRRGQSSAHGEARTPLILLLAITAIVLLIACANLANLLLVRGANRALEMAIRLSLGASRRQVLGQLLTESCLLALLGGAASLVVAPWTLALITSNFPPEEAVLLRVEFSPTVLLFASVLALGTGFAFGLFPALHSTRPDLVSSIRANAGQIAGSRAAARFRSGLVTAQIALAMALLISAGLFLRSLENISREELGVRVDSLVTFAVSPELNGYHPARSRVLFRRLEEELAALPGVAGVATAYIPILSGNGWWSSVSVEGFAQEPDTDANTSRNRVGPGYFRTLGVPLLSGREFDEGDDAGTPRVAVVNEAFVRRFGLDGDAVGKHVATERNENPDIQIVGVVRNTKYDEVKDAVPPQLFTPVRQDTTVGSLTFYVRTSGDPRQLLRAVPGVVARLDPNLPVENLKTMPQQVRENVSVDRMIGTLSAAFALLATLLAAIGLYGVLAYSVQQRTREIGVRMALGADGRQVRALVLRHVLRMAVVGGAIGIVAALVLGRAARSLLFGLDGHDPGVVALATLALSLVALGAGYIPALRASRIQPMQALRYE